MVTDWDWSYMVVTRKMHSMGPVVLMDCWRRGWSHEAAARFKWDQRKAAHRAGALAKHFAERAQRDGAQDM